ncbi:universal stress protein [Nocardioides campestrisoli]|uniref:universal stress protein n=1 Tax=Nocardioides campestrisoli TaxID=2736757 RepID=UPI0015E797B1|nr:universal stress protein [Nocardioides campestrisoli]
MDVVVATDGSKQSLAAARHLKSFADPAKIGTITVVAVIRPLAAVPFADDLPVGEEKDDVLSSGFRAQAEHAVATVAAVFDGWGPKVQRRIRSGSPATEILKVAKKQDAGLVVVASGSRGLSDTVLLGSTAQRVQQYAPCPVLVVRPAPRARRAVRKG